MFSPVREGNRGGKDQFKWDDVRLLPYKERECYLGVTNKLGYLDKGGKWRRRDWWLDFAEGGGENQLNQQMRDEISQVKKEDEALIRQKLGLESPKNLKDVLEEARGIDPSKMKNKLSSYEMKGLI